MPLVDKTVRVRRGGSYLTISVDSVDRYLAKGFDVIDDAGNVVKESIPHDVNVLQLAYQQHVAEIKELKKHIKELESRDNTLIESKNVKKSKRT